MQLAMVVRKHDSETICEEAANVLLAQLLRGHGIAAPSKRRSRRGTPDHAEVTEPYALGDLATDYTLCPFTVAERDGH